MWIFSKQLNLFWLLKYSTMNKIYSLQRRKKNSKFDVWTLEPNTFWKIKIIKWNACSHFKWTVFSLCFLNGSSCQAIVFIDFQLYKSTVEVFNDTVIRSDSCRFQFQCSVFFLSCILCVGTEIKNINIFIFQFVYEFCPAVGCSCRRLNYVKMLIWWSNMLLSLFISLSLKT